MVKSRSGFWGLLLLLLPAPGASAVSSQPDLDELLQVAQENSYEMRAAFEEWQGVRERITQVRSLPDPDLSYGYYLRRMETRQSVALSQMFPWPGKRGARQSAAERSAEMAEARFEEARARLVEEIRRRHSEGVLLLRTEAVMRENRQWLARVEQAAIRLFETGRGSYADVVRSQIELARLDDEIISVQRRFIPVLRGIEAVAGLPEHSLSGLSEQAGEAEGEVPAPDRLSESPLLAEARSAVALAAEERRVARQERLPDFMVGVEWMDNIGMARDEVAVMFSLNLPVRRARYAAAEREAERMWRGARLQEAGLERRLRAEWEETIFALEESTRRVALHDNVLIPRAREAAEAMTGAYPAGQAAFTDWIEVQRTLLDLQLERETLLAQRRDARAGLDRMRGMQP